MHMHGLSSIMLDTVHLCFELTARRCDWANRYWKRFKRGKKRNSGSDTWFYYKVCHGITLMVAVNHCTGWLSPYMPMILRITPYKYGLISYFLNWEIEGPLLVQRIQSALEADGMQMIPDFMRHNVSKLDIKRDNKLPVTVSISDLINISGSRIPLRAKRVNGLYPDNPNLRDDDDTQCSPTAYLNRAYQALCRIYDKAIEAIAHGDPLCQPNTLRVEVIAYSQDIRAMRDSKNSILIPERGITINNMFDPEVLNSVVARTEKLADIQPELEISDIEECIVKVEQSRCHNKTKQRFVSCLHDVENNRVLNDKEQKFFRSYCLKLKVAPVLRKRSGEQVDLQRLTEHYGIRDPRIEGLNVERAEELRRRDMEEYNRLQSNHKSYKLPTNKANKHENWRSPGMVPPVLHTVSSRSRFDTPVEVTLAVISSASCTYYTLPGSDRGPPIGL